MLVIGGGEGGIRTHVGLHPNGFQDRPVMTASVPLHIMTPVKGHKTYCTTGQVITYRNCTFYFVHQVYSNVADMRSTCRPYKDAALPE